MPRALLNFQYHKYRWWVHFIEADCQTSINPATRYYSFATLEDLRAFVLRCNPEDIAEFDRSARAWNRGSEYVDLAPDQYARLKQA